MWVITFLLLDILSSSDPVESITEVTILMMSFRTNVICRWEAGNERTRYEVLLVHGTVQNPGVILAVISCKQARCWYARHYEPEH